MSMPPTTRAGREVDFPPIKISCVSSPTIGDAAGRQRTDAATSLLFIFFRIAHRPLRFWQTDGGAISPTIGTRTSTNFSGLVTG
jgi:hypothetical protein